MGFLVTRLRRWKGETTCPTLRREVADQADEDLTTMTSCWNGALGSLPCDYKLSGNAVQTECWRRVTVTLGRKGTGRICLLEKVLGHSQVE